MLLPLFGVTLGDSLLLGCGVGGDTRQLHIDSRNILVVAVVQLRLGDDGSFQDLGRRGWQRRRAGKLAFDARGGATLDIRSQLRAGRSRALCFLFTGRI